MRNALSMSCAVVERLGPDVPVGEVDDTDTNVEEAGRTEEEEEEETASAPRSSIGTRSG